jgi:hypothetical protein
VRHESISVDKHWHPCHSPKLCNAIISSRNNVTGPSACYSFQTHSRFWRRTAAISGKWRVEIACFFSQHVNQDLGFGPADGLGLVGITMKSAVRITVWLVSRSMAVTSMV